MRRNCGPQRKEPWRRSRPPNLPKQGSFTIVDHLIQINRWDGLRIWSFLLSTIVLFVAKDNHNPMTSALAANKEATGPTLPLAPTTLEVDIRRQLPTQLRLQHQDQNERTLASLGSDKYNLIHYDADYYNYINGSDTIRVANRLFKHLEFWENVLKPSKFILNVIRQGYRIPFQSQLPSRAYLRNNKSALSESDFVLCTITELLNLGSVVQCDHMPLVVNPLSVSVQPNGKKRLILDLRHVNQFLTKAHVKFEDASFMFRLLSNHFSPKGWTCSFDIKSGYHHIDILPEHQEYLGFSWVTNGITKFFKYTVLPFGLSSGPYFFTKMLRPLVKY